MSYKNGTHILATLETTLQAYTNSFELFRNEINQLIASFGLTKLGEVYHNFTPQGFTAVICLSESHISIHTWPESDRLNMDIYLSNHQQVNDLKAAGIFEALVQFFEGKILQQQTINR